MYRRYEYLEVVFSKIAYFHICPKEKAKGTKCEGGGRRGKIVEKKLVLTVTNSSNNFNSSTRRKDIDKNVRICKLLAVVNGDVAAAATAPHFHVHVEKSDKIFLNIFLIDDLLSIIYESAQVDALQVLRLMYKNFAIGNSPKNCIALSQCPGAKLLSELLSTRLLS